MPKAWIYYIALIFPLVLRVLVLNTPFVDWLWYHGYHDSYYIFSALRVNPMFLEFIGGWPLPVFIGTVWLYWFMDEEFDAVPKQFLLLPLVFVPFSIIGTALANLSFDPATLYTHPLAVIPAGYLYIMPWVVLVWALAKCRLVMEM